MKKKVFAFRFSSPEEAAEFLDYVSRLIGNLAAEVRGSSVKIVVMAPPGEAESDFARIREVLRQWRMSRHFPRKGLYRHSLQMILSAASLKVSIPIAALVDSLKLSGFKARLDKVYLVTDARFDKVVEVASNFSAKYLEALRLPATPILKRLLAVLATVLDTSIDESLKKLLELGLARLDEESGRFLLTVNYTSALERLKDSMRSEREGL
ncbi:MAG: hypothetical protein DRJ43_00230 [Thermoprotei archaeon]|nr:MAG: hypothetical protein DRJ43_00230 [Thermoprotei archaeon]